MRKTIASLIVALLLSGCATAPAPTPTPSSLTPQATLIFGLNKNGRRLYVLNDEFPYCDKATGRVYVVPKGYVTDFASVPWYGRAVIDPEGPTARAAIIHDWLYAIGEKGKREEADVAFYRAMKFYGVDEAQSRIAYNAVHIGGAGGYGLKSDWLFLDPRAPDTPLPAPIAKPSTAVVKVLPKCEGFRELVASGWKAYLPMPKAKPRFRLF
jgi:hypothetical protein